MSQKSLLEISKASFKYFDEIFSIVEQNQDLASCFVFCDSWLRGDDFPPTIAAYVKEKFSVRPSLTLRSIIGRKYRRTQVMVRWLLFLLKVILFNPNLRKKFPNHKNILFLNTKKYGMGPAKDLEKVIGEPFACLDLKSNLSSVLSGNAFNIAVTRELLLTTFKQTIRVVGKKNKYKTLKVSVFQIFCGLLTRNAAYSFFKFSGAERVVIVGSLTNPHVRRNFYACQQLNIDSTLYIPRTISPISIPMLSGMKNALWGLPNRIFTSNLFSERSLIEVLKEKDVHISTLISADVSSREVAVSQRQRALFLLGLDRLFNLRLLEFLQRNTIFEDRAVVRVHPLDDRSFYERSLSKLKSRVRLSNGRPLSTELHEAKVCYLYPSEAFVEVVKSKVPVCWMAMDVDLPAMENIFWSSIGGNLVNDFGQLLDHYQNICKPEWIFEESNLANNAADFEKAENPFELLALRLKDEGFN